jgi:hypothetical protein
VLVDAFPSWKASVGTLRVYAASLQDVRPEALEAAVMHVVKTCKFPPTVAELREIAELYVPGEHCIPSASEAWAEVDQKRKSGMHYDTPELSHPLVGDALRVLGSWRRFCSTPTDRLTSDRARYCSFYEDLARKHSQEQVIEEVRRLLKSLDLKFLRRDTDEGGQPDA